MAARGVHLHVGSQLGAVDAWRDAVRRGLAVLGLLRGGLDAFDTLDLGGGFPVVALGQPAPARPIRAGAAGAPRGHPGGPPAAAAGRRAGPVPRGARRVARVARAPRPGARRSPGRPRCGHDRADPARAVRRAPRIVALTSLGRPVTGGEGLGTAHVEGPICESTDHLGSTPPTSVVAISWSSPMPAPTRPRSDPRTTAGRARCRSCSSRDGRLRTLRRRGRTGSSATRRPRYPVNRVRDPRHHRQAGRTATAVALAFLCAWTAMVGALALPGTVAAADASRGSALPRAGTGPGHLRHGRAPVRRDRSGPPRSSPNASPTMTGGALAVYTQVAADPGPATTASRATALLDQWSPDWPALGSGVLVLVDGTPRATNRVAYAASPRSATACRQTRSRSPRHAVLGRCWRPATRYADDDRCRGQVAHRVVSRDGGVAPPASRRRPDAAPADAPPKAHPSRTPRSTARCTTTPASSSPRRSPRSSRRSTGSRRGPRRDRGLHPGRLVPDRRTNRGERHRPDRPVGRSAAPGSTMGSRSSSTSI